MRPLVLAVVLLALAGCGGNGDTGEDPGGATTGPATTATEPADDY